MGRLVALESGSGSRGKWIRGAFGTASALQYRHRCLVIWRPAAIAILNSEDETWICRAGTREVRGIEWIEIGDHDTIASPSLLGLGCVRTAQK